ncbi:MAG: STAS domain-containing protein [Gammaproteobacteria bacterium]|nr:STAS domain-containing protein [Gammaproteobacteria bacterium]
MQTKINKQKEGIYAIEGELNMQTVPAVSKQLLDLISGVDGDTFTLDLALVSRSDSAGVALLVDAMQIANKTKCTLLFSNLPQQMQDIAGISGLLDILPLNKK